MRSEEGAGAGYCLTPMEACSPWGGQGSRLPARRPQPVRDVRTPRVRVPTLTATGPPCRSASWPQNLRSTNTICPACWPTRCRTLTVRVPSRSGAVARPVGHRLQARPGVEGAGVIAEGARVPGDGNAEAARPPDRPRRLPSSAPAGRRKGVPCLVHLSPPRPAPCRDCQQQHHQRPSHRTPTHGS